DHDPAVSAREPLEGLQVEAACARPSVEEYERALAFAQESEADDSAFDLYFTAFLGHTPPETGGAARRAAPRVSPSGRLARPLRGRTCPLRRTASATRCNR